MRFPSMLRRLRNTRGGGTRSTAGSGSTPYMPYTPEPPMPDPPTEQDPPAAPGAVPNPNVSPSTPVAHITTEKTTVSVDTLVTFDGSGSTGRDLTYLWDFGDGAEPTAATTTTPRTSCEYDTPGEKSVTLTVVDNREVQSEVATLNITVIELALDGPATVTRGETAKYKAKIKPDELEPTYNWRFTGEGITIEIGNGERTWAGLMVVSGAIVVTTVVNGENFTKSVVTTVEPKEWSDNFPTPPITHREPGTLRSNPTKNEHLGHTVNSPANPGQTSFTVPDIDVQVTVVTDTGPNAGWMFIENAPIASKAWKMEGHTSSALTNEGHSFYQLNQGRYGAEYMRMLAERIRIHEGVQLDLGGRYISHAHQGLAAITANPLNPWAAKQFAHFAVINSQDPEGCGYNFWY